MNDVTKEVRAYIYSNLNGLINHNGSVVPIVAKPTAKTAYPFISVKSSSFVDDGTKDLFGGIHEVEIRVNTRYSTRFGGQDDADEISNLITNQIRTRGASSTWTDDYMYIFKQVNQRWEEDDDGKYDYFTKVLIFQAYVLEIPEN